MRILRRQKGLPFLLALGTLFLLSASFLAVQIWSDAGRGIVSALEAPSMLPPSFGSNELAVTQTKKAADEASKSKPVIATKVANITVEPTVAAPSTKSIAVVSNVLPVKKNENNIKLVVAALPEKIAIKSAAKDKPVVVIEPAQEKASSKSSTLVSAPEVAKAVTPAVKKVSAPVVKTVKLTAKILKRSKSPSRVVTPKKVVDYGEIPPEWNWFDKPLKLNVSDNGVSITSDVSKVAVNAENSRSVAASRKYFKPSSAITSKPAVVVSQKTITRHAASKKTEVAVAAYVAENPFAKTLAKMQKRSAKRVVEARRLGITLPSNGGKVSSKVLRNVLTKIDTMKDVVEVSLFNATDAVALAQPMIDNSDVRDEEAVGAVDTKTHSANSYHWSSKKAGGSFYEGSGSSFSNRIQYLIKSGALLRSKD